MARERLQKLIARAGMCSRRDAEELIREGRVRVNGVVATLGTQADPEVDSVKVDGTRLRAPEPLRYVLLYKPREVMTTCEDPEKRETVLDLLRSLVPERVFPVGRLDYHSEGLLLLTNDGELAARVTHPRYGLLREYLVKVRGELGVGSIERLMKGTVIDGRQVKPVDVVRTGATRSGSNTWWRVRVAEGRTHEVRELFFRAGHHVQRLRRSAIGPLRDDSLRPGEFRDLTPFELKALRSATATTRRDRARVLAPSIGRSGRRSEERLPEAPPPDGGQRPRAVRPGGGARPQRKDGGPSQRAVERQPADRGSQRRPVPGRRSAAPDWGASATRGGQPGRGTASSGEDTDQGSRGPRSSKASSPARRAEAPAGGPAAGDRRFSKKSPPPKDRTSRPKTRAVSGGARGKKRK